MKVPLGKRDLLKLVVGEHFMYKNLSPRALGITGRQSEVIELALTYGFKGLDVDMVDIAKRVERHGQKHAFRFIESARLKVGGFELPVRLAAEDADYETDLSRLEPVAEAAAALGAQRCFVILAPASESLPYHENFELHRKRITQVAEALSQHKVELAVGVRAAAAVRQDRNYEFVWQAEALTALIKALGQPNVGLLLDTWNWEVGGGTLDSLREASDLKIVVLRVSDLPDDVELADVNENQRLLPGETGRIDVAAYLALLTERGYEGPVTVFPHPSQFTGMTRDNIVHKAGTSLDEQWRSSGLAKAARATVGAEK